MPTNPVPHYPSSFLDGNPPSTFNTAATSVNAWAWDNVARHTELKDVTIGIPVSGGVGYTSAPTVAFARGTGDTTGSGAAATAYINAAGQVYLVTVTNGGSNYTVEPTVSFSGGGGTGATAQSFIQNGIVESVVCYTQEYPTNIAIGGQEPIGQTDLYEDFLTVLTQSASEITNMQTALSDLASATETIYTTGNPNVTTTGSASTTALKDFVLNMHAQKFYIISEKLMDVNFQLKRLTNTINLASGQATTTLSGGTNTFSDPTSAQATQGAAIGVTAGTLGVSRYPSGQNRGY